jgi:hypothetical protein
VQHRPADGGARPDEQPENPTKALQVIVSRVRAPLGPEVLQQASDDIRELDRADVRGTPTRHFTMTFDLRAVPAFTRSPAADLVRSLSMSSWTTEVASAGSTSSSPWRAWAASPSPPTTFDFGVPASVQLPDPALVTPAPAK